MSGVRAAALSAGLAAVFMAGCGANPPVDVRLLTAPIEVRTRPELPACPAEIMGAGVPFNLEGRKCFWDAYAAGELAEFVSTRPAASGDSLLVIWRTLGERGVEFFVDETSLRGEPWWSLTTCNGFTKTNDPAVAIDWVPGAPLGEICDERRLQ